MEPKIPDGATIIVQRLKEVHSPKRGKIVVCSDGHGLSFKELGYRAAKEGEEANGLGTVPILKSLNSDFPEVQTMEGGHLEAVWVETL